MLLCLLFVPSDPYTDIYVYFFLQNLRKLKFFQKSKKQTIRVRLGLLVFLEAVVEKEASRIQRLLRLNLYRGIMGIMGIDA